MGAGAIDKLPDGIKKDPEAVAETITNNMRKVIIDERAMNPKYYDKMSELLDALIEQRRQGALDYQAYLAKLLEAARSLAPRSRTRSTPTGQTTAPRRRWSTSSIPRTRSRSRSTPSFDTPSLTPGLATRIKERKVKNAIKATLPDDFDRLDELFELVKARHEYR